jgi:DNA polymerase-4
MGGSLYRQARGLGSDRVGVRGGRQSISKETTFNQDITGRERLRATLRDLASEVGHSLRKAGLMGQVVTLKLRLGGFETHTRQRRLPVASDSDAMLFQLAWELFICSPFVDRPIRLIGVGISDWGDGRGETLDLFASGADRERERRLYSMLDDAAERFGEGKLSLGVPTRKQNK